MMISLLIESGSSKSDCIIFQGDQVMDRFETAGLNPTTMDLPIILDIILDIKQKSRHEVSSIFFYGSGVRFETKDKLAEGFKKYFEIERIEIFSDLLAAVRACTQGAEGIVCILGTGSNSCLSDGHQITHQKISLGYILGDEGSANDLGKKLITNYYYNVLKDEIRVKLESQFPNLSSNFITEFYNSNFKSALLGQFGKFVVENKSNPQMEDIVYLCLNSFYHRRLSYYSDYADLPIYFVGSVAYHLQEEIQKVISPYGFQKILFSKKPIDDLLRYHMKHERN